MSTRGAFGTQAGYAYQRLREWIISGRLRSGEGLVTENIAKEIGVSRTPVRDALKQLAYERLVTGGDGRNWAVASFAPQNMQGLYIVREALESDSARLCAQNATRGDVERLFRIVERFELAVADSTPAEEVELERGFHLAVAEIGGCAELQEEIERWLTALIVSIRMTLGRPGPRVHPHRGIVEAIASGDPDLAEKAMREHVQSSRLICEQAGQRQQERGTLACGR